MENQPTSPIQQPIQQSIEAPQSVAKPKHTWAILGGLTATGILIAVALVFIGIQIGKSSVSPVKNVPPSALPTALSEVPTQQEVSRPTEVGLPPSLNPTPISIPSDWKEFTAIDHDFGVRTTLSLPPGFSFFFSGSEFVLQNDSDASENWDYSTSIFGGINGVKNYYSGSSRREWYQQMLNGDFMPEKPYDFEPGKITNVIERQIGSQNYLEITVKGGPPANFIGDTSTHYVFEKDGIVHIIKPSSEKANSAQARLPAYFGTIFVSISSAAF